MNESEARYQSHKFPRETLESMIKAADLKKRKRTSKGSSTFSGVVINWIYIKTIKL